MGWIGKLWRTIPLQFRTLWWSRLEVPSTSPAHILFQADDDGTHLRHAAERCEEMHVWCETYLNRMPFVQIQRRSPPYDQATFVLYFAKPADAFAFKMRWM